MFAVGRTSYISITLSVKMGLYVLMRTNNVANDHVMVEHTVLSREPAPSSEGDHGALRLPVNRRRKGLKSESDGDNKRGLGKHRFKGL